MTLPLDQSGKPFEDTGAVIDASPPGTAHAVPIPRRLLMVLGAADAGAIVFDMVYDLLETDLLSAARKRGLRTVDSLVMPVGQARTGLPLFFGAPQLQKYSKLREMLVNSSPRV